jgi:hypothetical protein
MRVRFPLPAPRNLMRKVAISLIILPAVAIWWILFYGNGKLGLLLNQYFACTQNPENSFPCHGIYEIWVVGILAIICVIGLILLILSFKKVR